MAKLRASLAQSPPHEAILVPDVRVSGLEGTVSTARYCPSTIQDLSRARCLENLLQKSIPTQICQLVLYIGNSKGQVVGFVEELTSEKRHVNHFGTHLGGRPGLAGLHRDRSRLSSSGHPPSPASIQLYNRDAARRVVAFLPFCDSALMNLPHPYGVAYRRVYGGSTCGSLEESH